MAIDQDMEQLVLRPFREVIERGTSAVTNAEMAFDDDEEASSVLFKAGQSLVKEGERALKRLQPLCEGHEPKVSDALKALLMTGQSEDIVSKQRRIEDILYDFEDFVHIQSFDAAKFADLQAATKLLALAVLETVRKLKMDPKDQARVVSFPPLPPLPTNNRSPGSPSNRYSVPTAPHPITRGSQHPLTIRTRFSNQPRNSVVMASSHTQQAFLPSIPQNIAGQPMGQALSFSYDAMPTPPLPPPSVLSHSSLQLTPPQGTSLRDDASITFSESPPPSRANRPVSPDDPDHDMEKLMFMAGCSISPVDDKPPSFTFRRTPLVEPTPFPPPSMNEPVTPRDDRFLGLPTDQITISDQVSAITDLTHSDQLSTVSSMTRSTASTEIGQPTGMYSVRSMSMGGPAVMHVRPDPRDPRFPLVPGGTESTHSNDLPQPIAEEWESSDTASMPRTVSAGYPPWRQVEIAIGSKSSVAQMNGVCSGATAFRNGPPWEAVKRLGGHVEAQSAINAGYGFEKSFNHPTTAMYNNTMAQCNACDFAQEHVQLTQDLDRDLRANFKGEGVRFRKRFLYKSHVPTQTMNKAYYACIFCVQSGTTLREGDATVFAGSSQLLRHLARHPQPLPEVPGVTVLYGAAGPGDIYAQDYDVQFPSPPLPGAMPENVSMGFMPVAVATRDHLQVPGEKKLERPDRELEVLQFFVGARILGVEFPDRWKGRWCRGWHDDCYGVFPIKSVELEPPRRTRAPMPNLHSRRNGTAKWKWDPRAGLGWLPFDKGDQINNLDWDDPEAWYWLGTNSKGRFGVFPRSHIRLESVQDGSLVKGSSGGSRSSLKKSRIFGLK